MLEKRRRVGRGGGGGVRWGLGHVYWIDNKSCGALMINICSLPPSYYRVWLYLKIYVLQQKKVFINFWAKFLRIHLKKTWMKLFWSFERNVWKESQVYKFYVILFFWIYFLSIIRRTKIADSLSKKWKLDRNGV